MIPGDINRGSSQPPWSRPSPTTSTPCAPPPPPSWPRPGAGSPRPQRATGRRPTGGGASGWCPSGPTPSSAEAGAWSPSATRAPASRCARPGRSSPASGPSPWPPRLTPCWDGPAPAPERLPADLVHVDAAGAGQAPGRGLDVGQGLAGVGRVGVAGGLGQAPDPVPQGLAGPLDVGVVDLAQALVEPLGGLLGLGRGLLHVAPVDPGQLADQPGAVGRLVDPLLGLLGLLGGLA